MPYLYLTCAILAEVIATSFLKKSAGFTVLTPTIVVIVGYMLAFYFLSLTLNTIPVAVAYAIWSGVGMVLITLAGMVFYKQIPNIFTIMGIGLIIGGVTLLHVNSE
jgi:small multidrug resistance pump